MRRPTSSTPVSPLTPSSEPVLPRNLPAERGADELVVERAVHAGDRQAVVERGEPGPVGEAERGDEVGAGHPVAAVEARAVDERAAGDRHARAPGSLAVVAATPAAVVPVLGRLDADLLGEQLRGEVVARRRASRPRWPASVARSTWAISTAPAGAVPVPDEPTATPRARSRSASSRRGVRRWVVDRHLAAGCPRAEPVVHGERAERADFAIGAVGALPRRAPSAPAS